MQPGPKRTAKEKQLYYYTSSGEEFDDTSSMTSSFGSDSEDFDDPEDEESDEEAEEEEYEDEMVVEEMKDGDETDIPDGQNLASGTKVKMSKMASAATSRKRKFIGGRTVVMCKALP